MTAPRVRIAPSPTGNLHIGTARAALFNYLFAKHNNGTFILRIEDTDLERSDKKYEQNIFEGLRWLDINPDEGPEQGGPYGPYRQSERTERYREYFLGLLVDKKVYACFHSKEELTINSAGTETRYGTSTLHNCSYRDLPFDPNEMRSFVIRYKNDAYTAFLSRMRGGIKKTEENFKRPLRTGDEIQTETFQTSADDYVHFDDEVRGGVDTPKDILGDFIVAKSLNEALYNFTVVVDDHDMEITHVIRGEDHIPNTPKQIQLIEALGFERPKYAHLPLILGPDRSKLSKRHGATSVLEYKEQGYLPEALLNFMALLGWNHGGDQEIFSKEELIAKFSLEKVQKSGAIFDTKKLDWMNGEYIREQRPEVLTKEFAPQFYAMDSDTSTRAVQLEQPRLTRLSEIGELLTNYLNPPEYDKSMLRWRTMSDEEILTSLDTSIHIINKLNQSPTAETIEEAFMKAIGEGDKGVLLWPLRVALIGRKASPGPFEIMAVLGIEESLKRIRSAIQKYAILEP